MSYNRCIFTYIIGRGILCIINVKKYRRTHWKDVIIGSRSVLKTDGREIGLWVRVPLLPLWAYCFVFSGSVKIRLCSSWAGVVKKMEVWVSGLNQLSAKESTFWGPLVRIQALPQKLWKKNIYKNNVNDMDWLIISMLKVKNDIDV